MKCYQLGDITMAKASLKAQTPVGDLNWMFITGEGKADLNGNLRYSASVYFDTEAQAKPLIDKLMAFWEENKPKDARKPKSIGVYHEVKMPDGKLSQTSYTQPYDKDEMTPTGRIVVSAWTGTTYADGKQTKVKTFNAKGAEVALGDKIIGPGSRGALSISAGIYSNGPNMGITLYLNGVVISKFAEFSGGAVIEAIDDEDGWTGADLSDDGIEPIQDTPAPKAPANTPKVKL